MADRTGTDSGNPQLGTYHIATFAIATPDHPAVIAGGTGSTMTYAELDLRSRKLAAYLSANRIAKGDHIAIMMANSQDYLAVCWAAQRLGLVYTPINWHVDFASLPRLPNGKMLKRQLRDQYLAPRRFTEPSQENNI
jgi:acyl-CoA synthetase (AMP-forming)/AMP-acid ligase II